VPEEANAKDAESVEEAALPEEGAEALAEGQGEAPSEDSVDVPVECKAEVTLESVAQALSAVDPEASDAEAEPSVDHIVEALAVDHTEVPASSADHLSEDELAVMLKTGTAEDPPERKARPRKVVVEEEGEEEEEEPQLQLREVPDDGIPRRWYALHAHSGQEGNVQKMLLVASEQQGLGDMVTNVLVPMEQVTEMRAGEKRMAKHKFFPGYVLLQLPEHPEQHPELWHLIKETPGVTGFIGSRTAPVPLEDEEVDSIVEVIRGERERPKPKVAFEKDERIKIIDGPFANFLGKIDEVNYERSTMKVMVEIFERLTSIEVEFWQVEQV